jgi:ABC-type phosphate transport system substrate-binding protein
MCSVGVLNTEKSFRILLAMRRHTKICLFALLFLVLPYCAANAQTFVVQGSTTFTHRIMEPYQAAIEASSGHGLTVIPNKSSLGLLALFDKRADFAMISGPLENEVERLRQTNANLPFDQLRNFNIFNTRMAFAVNRDNPVDELTVDQMRGILIGEITNWNQVGGRDLPIRIVQVREGGGVQASIEDVVLNGKTINVKNPILVQISSQVVKVVEQLPEALGLSQLSIVAKSNSNELKLDRPVEQHLNFVTLGDPSPEMLNVIRAATSIANTSLDR